MRAGYSMRFDDFFATLQAVADGLGFGIGPFPAFDAGCASGRLVQPFPALMSPGASYYALVPLDADKPAHMRDVVAWLQQDGEKGGKR